MGKRFARLFEVVDQNKPWKIYRHISALVGLLKPIGLWIWSAPVFGIAIGACIESIPWWGRMVIGLCVANLVIWLFVGCLAGYQKIQSSAKTESHGEDKKPLADEINLDENNKTPPPNTVSAKFSMAVVAVLTLILLVASGLLIVRYQKPRVVFLTQDQARQLELIHENGLLRYEARRSKLAPLYKDGYDIAMRICKPFKVSNERIASDCRLDIGKGKASLEVSNPQINGCFEYDPKQLYVTKTILTLFAMSDYTILGNRNWPVAFESADDAGSFVGLARDYTKACYVGGVHSPTLSDVIIQWPTKPKVSIGLCEDISSERLTVLEKDGAAYVMDAKRELLRLDNTTEAKAAIDLMRTHHSMCVIGGIPGITARDPVVSGWDTIAGDRVVYLN